MRVCPTGDSEARIDWDVRIYSGSVPGDPVHAAFGQCVATDQFLIELILTIYKKPEHLPKVLNTRYTGFHGWFVDFAGPMNDKRRRGRRIFCDDVSDCIDAITSEFTGIQDRLSNIDAYSKLFHELIQLHLADIDELVKLRDLLKKHTFDITKPLQEVGEYMLARTSWLRRSSFGIRLRGRGLVSRAAL